MSGPDYCLVCGVEHQTDGCDRLVTERIFGAVAWAAMVLLERKEHAAEMRDARREIREAETAKDYFDAGQGPHWFGDIG